MFCLLNRTELLYQEPSQIQDLWVRRFTSARRLAPVYPKLIAHHLEVKLCKDRVQWRRKRGSRGSSCSPIQKLGGANIPFCSPKILEGGPVRSRSGNSSISLESPSKGPSVCQRGPLSAERASVGSRGPSLGLRGPSVGSRGPSVGQSRPLSVPGALRRSEGPSVGARGPLSFRGAHCWLKRALCRSEGPIVGSRGPSVSQRGPLSIREALCRFKGSSVDQRGPLSFSKEPSVGQRDPLSV